MLHTIQINPAYSYVKKDSPRMITIAPASEKYIALDLKRCNSRSNSYVGAQAASIARRNARERNRVKQVNDSYNALRKRLPAAIVTALSGGSRRGSGKKLSKVDTLKMVVEYIRYLERIVEENDAAFVVNSQYDEESVFIRGSDGVTEMSPYEEKGVFAGGNSPYLTPVPSPIGSESSGVYSAYSNSGCNLNTCLENQLNPIEEDHLLDAISWWQEK